MIDAALAAAVEPGLALVDIPDDRAVEARYPHVKWAGHPRLRRAQRKCLLMAEYCRDHPEGEADIVAKNKAREAKSQGFTESGRRIVDGWDGIETTAPASLGLKLTRGDKRGGARDD